MPTITRIPNNQREARLTANDAPEHISTILARVLGRLLRVEEPIDRELEEGPTSSVRS